MKQLLKYFFLVLGLTILFQSKSYAPIRIYQEIESIIGYCVKYKVSKKDFTVEALEFQGSCPEINFISKKKYLNQFNKINLFYIKNEYHFPEWQIVPVVKKKVLFMIQGTSLYDSFFNVLTEKIITSEKEDQANQKARLKAQIEREAEQLVKKAKKKDSPKYQFLYKKKAVIQDLPSKEVKEEKAAALKSSLPVKTAALQAALPEFKPKIGRDDTGPIIEMIGKIITDKRHYTIRGKVSDEGSKKIFVSIDDNYIIEAMGGKFSFDRFTIENEKVKITAIDQSGNETSKFISVVVTKGTPNFYALIIGNNEYQYLEKLDAAENDAREVAKVLEHKYKFKVTRLYNATRKDTVKAIYDVSRELNVEDNLLIYYAGHGIFDEKENEGYWLAIDAADDTSVEGIGNTWITKQVKATKARHVLLLIDSCFAGSITKTRSASNLVPRENLDPKFIERKSSKKSRMVITSGGNEPVVDSDGGDHSWFAKKLLEILKENNDVIYSLNIYDELSKYVINNADQTPAMAIIRGTDHNDGEFFFFSKY
mgnify:FL=1